LGGARRNFIETQCSGVGVTPDIAGGVHKPGPVSLVSA